MAQSRKFCLTIYSPEQGKKPKEPGFPDFVDFFIGQRERCPTTNRLHYQCYFEVAKKKTLSSVIKLWETFLGHHSFHILIANGSQHSNIVYCSKEASFEGHRFRYGEPMNQGQRNDLKEIAEAIKSGVTETEIFETNPHWFHLDKYMNRLIQAKNAVFKNKLRDIKVIYVYGPPGTGKSRFVWDSIKDKSYYQPPPMKNKTLWFDGYTGQDILWLEDVDLEDFDRSYVLRLLDRYPLTCEIKGGTTQACWTTVYITSNMYPEYLEEAIQRRFTEIVPLETELPSFESVPCDELV